MKPLPQIAAEMGLTQEQLRARFQHEGPNPIINDQRREFVVQAFAQGHDLKAIQDFIQRTRFMVEHALRMHCLSTIGGDYSRSPAELAQILRSAA